MVQANIAHLGLRCFLVKGKTSIDLSGNPARDDSENLLAEFDKLIMMTNTMSTEHHTIRIILTSLSIAALTWVSMSPPLDLPKATAASMRRAYPALLAAAKISDGLVVASCNEFVSIPRTASIVPACLWLVDIDGYIVDIISGISQQHS